MAIATTSQVTTIARLYTALFNRAPDTAGLSFWSNALANGASIATVTQGFLNAPEGVSQYPAFQSATAFVTSFYTKVFGRSPDTAGLAFWVAALNNLGGVDSATAKAALASKIIEVVSTPLSATDAALAANAQTVADRATFANKVELGTYLASNSAVTTLTAKSFDPTATTYVSVTADPSTIDALKAGIFNTQIALASGPNILGTDSGDLFISTIAQLNATTTRVYDGAAGADTLNLDMTVTPGATLRDGSVINVETVKLIGTTTATSIDASKAFVGSTNIIVDAANGGSIIGLAGKTLGFSGGTAGNATVTANFGSAATTAAISLNSIAASTGVAAVPAIAAALLLGSSTGVTTSALASATVSGSGTLTIANSYDAAATAAANLATGSSLKTVNVASTGTITLTTTATNSSVTAIDASTSTGAVTANISSLQSYKGGAGVDTVVLTAAPTKLIDGGAGTNDVITVNSGTTADILAASAGNITGFETISLGAASAATSVSVAPFIHVLLDKTLLNAVAFTGATAGTDLTIKAAATFATSFALADSSGTADALTITLSSATGLNNTGVLTVAGIESLKVVSTDTATTSIDAASVLKLTAAAATSLTVTGNTGIDFIGSTAAKITSFDATGLVIGTATADAAKFTSTNDTVGAAVSIKGALNGVNTLSGAAANDTIVGGAGNDSITSGTGLDILTGAGGNDTFVVTANANKSIFATITDFNKGDILNVAGELFTGHTTYTAGVVTKVALAAGTFDQLLTAAVTNAGVTATNSVATWFQFGTDTYVVLDNSTTSAFVDGTDQIVKLTGLVDLTTATINATGTSLTIA